MWRVLLYLVLLAIAAAGAVWLADHPETVSVTWGGREYTTSLAVGAVAIAVLAIALAALFALVSFLLRLPSTVGRKSRRRRHAKGLSALSRGIVAVGAGDAAAARRHAGDAERLLGQEPLTLLLKAQAAQASGNREAAEATFREMSELPETRVLGLRGLYVEARRRGDHAAARQHAEEAARAAPAVAWANDAVLEGHSADGNWAGAIGTLERRTSLGLVDRTTSRRHRAVLHAADALSRESTDPEGALTAALEAVRLAPELVPSAALAGRLLSRRGDLKRAAKIVETAWRESPHPDLAEVYLDLRPGDSATDRLRRAETLARLSSWAPESRLAIARAALDARDPARARDAVRPILEGRPPLRVCLMMADIEEADGATGRVREWLARAARSPRDKAWIADGVVAERWAPVSPVTGRLDAFVWDTPPDTIGASLEPFPALDSEPPPPEALLPPPPVAEPVAIAPVALPASSPAAVATVVPEAPSKEAPPLAAASRTVEVPGGALEPEPVVFPVPHAPDDPGSETEGGRSRFRLIG